MSSNKKRVLLSIKDKYEIIKLKDSGIQNIDIMVKFGLKHSSNVTMILKQREKIINAFEKGNYITNRKKLRFGDFSQIEEKLKVWIEKIWDKQIPLSEELLKEKAMQISHEFGNTSKFVASNGWLEGFRKRNDILFKNIQGESASVPQNIVSDWITKLELIIADYEINDIYNGDEFGVFWKCMPNKTMLLKGQSCKGGKRSKERVSIYACTNMSGTDKLRLVVIGKYKNPRCFKGIIRKPVDYYHNQKAWMTSETFTSILSKFNKKLIKEERKVLLFLDNCSCHSENLSFSNIKIVFLPKNSTSVLQPCDAGIIKCIKGQYRTQLVKHLIAYLDNEKNSVPAINLLDAIYMLSASWRKITDNTIKNCFIKCGFVKDANQEIEIVSEVANEEQNNI